jgi:predicted HTH domain antitoxin
MQEHSMQTVSIRQLKSNPSTALRAAREDDLVIVTNRDQPEALLISLDKLGLPDVDVARTALAVALFKNGAISASAAARMAGKPLPEMLTLLSGLGIPLSAAGSEEIRDEMKTVREWLQRQS